MNAHGTKMTAITRELWNQWMTTKESWQDAKAVEFEKKYLEDLLASVNKAVIVIEELDKLTSKIKKDCE
jgi:Cdc6-like AAA superfamily ATPase